VSSIPWYALISEKAFVGSTVHQGAAFLTGHIIRGCLCDRDFVFRSAIACMRSGQPFYEFCHPGNMRPESIRFQPVGLPQSNWPTTKKTTRENRSLYPSRDIYNEFGGLVGFPGAF
jgi:hypothetical protein